MEEDIITDYGIIRDTKVVKKEDKHEQPSDLHLEFAADSFNFDAYFTGQRGQDNGRQWFLSPAMETKLQWIYRAWTSMMHALREATMEEGLYEGYAIPDEWQTPLDWDTPENSWGFRSRKKRRPLVCFLQHLPRREMGTA